MPNRHGGEWRLVAIDQPINITLGGDAHIVNLALRASKGRFNLRKDMVDRVDQCCSGSSVAAQRMNRLRVACKRIGACCEVSA